MVNSLGLQSFRNKVKYKHHAFDFEIKVGFFVLPMIFSKQQWYPCSTCFLTWLSKIIEIDVFLTSSFPTKFYFLNVFASHCFWFGSLERNTDRPKFSKTALGLDLFQTVTKSTGWIFPIKVLHERKLALC